VLAHPRTVSRLGVSFHAPYRLARLLAYSIRTGKEYLRDEPGLYTRARRSPRIWVRLAWDMDS